MQPGENPSLLTQMTLGITPNFLIVADVRLLEIIAATHQQELETVVISRAPIKLDGSA